MSERGTFLSLIDGLKEGLVFCVCPLCWQGRGVLKKAFLFLFLLRVCTGFLFFRFFLL